MENKKGERDGKARANIELAEEGKMIEEIKQMKIKGDKFFVLEIGQDRWVLEGESEAVKLMKEMIPKTTNVSHERVSILEVNIKEKNWEIKELPWSRVAMMLIRGEV